MVKAFFVGVKSILNDIEKPRYILPVSVGQPYHDGDQLNAIIELINKKNFSKGMIVVASVLQRHTLGLIHKDLTEDELTQLSYKKGVEWQERNKFILNKLNHPIEIVDWSFFLGKNEYKKRIDEMISFYQENFAFRESIDITIDKFLNRWVSRDIIKESDIDSAILPCKKYIIEECAVTSLWMGQGFHCVVYPSSLSPAMSAAYERFITPSYPPELVWLRVYLRGTTKAKCDIIGRENKEMDVTSK